MDIKEIEQHIITSHLLHGLTDDEVKNIIEQGLIAQFLKDKVIFYQGSIGSQVYLILNGSIGICQDNKEISRLGEGEIIGEMALLTKQPRSATAKALENSYVLIFTATTFEKLLNRKVAVRLLLNILDILCERLKITNQSISI
ncbi:MAG TPA: cyclic nucleotide-binding domain-containing protein [Candidatus Hydrogenedens sp.]|nr:cyclic nucleotide-binding domain-containing protein [Candidatus Hydrogenedens sp.]